MPRSLSLALLALATLSATAYAQYPAPYPAYPAGQPNYQQQPQQPRQPMIQSTEPVEGIWLRTEPSSSVKTISANVGGTSEFRVEHGRANIQVDHAPANSQILVDLPGGQVTLLKDGLYTFNADTNTVRVLRGEAETYTDANSKGIKIKEDHQVVFASGNAPKSVEVDYRQVASDVLPTGRGGDGGYPARGYGYGPYGDGFYAPPYPYPYYAYGYPYYPYGYGFGYPFGFGIGFGYYGGFRGGFRR